MAEKNGYANAHEFADGKGGPYNVSELKLEGGTYQIHELIGDGGPLNRQELPDEANMRRTADQIKPVEMAG